MSHRRAKLLRKLLTPKLKPLSKTRVSQGQFLRATTCYKMEQTAIIKIPWPLQVLFGKLPIQKYRRVLGDCPRLYIQQTKRSMRQWRSA